MVTSAQELASTALGAVPEESSVARVILWSLVAVHLGLLLWTVNDHFVSIDSGYHVSLGRYYAEHLTAFWDHINYGPYGRPNLQGPLLHVGIGALGWLFGGSGDDYVLAVGHAALEAAGAVGGPLPRALLAALDRVVGLGAGAAAGGQGGADLHRLDGRYRHHRLGQPAVELLVPLRVRAEAGGHAVGDHGDRAAQGVAVVAGLVDQGDHLGLQGAVDGSQR